MSKKVTYKPKPLKSREEKSNLIRANIYKEKVNFLSDFKLITPLQSKDLGSGYHIFIESKKLYD